MQKILPQEFINISVENHFSKFNKKSNVIYWIAIVIFLTASVLTFIINIEITVLSRGIIRSVSEPVQVISPVSARVTSTYVRENKPVKQGDTLVYLDIEKQTEKISHFQKLIDKNILFLNDLNKMLYSNPVELKTLLFQTLWDEFRQKTVEFDLNINLLEKSFNRNRVLFNKGVIPAAELEEQEYELANIIEEKNAFIKQNRNQWQQMTEEYENANHNYSNEINILQKELENYYIISPGNGYLVNANGINPGSFLTAGQTIAVINPEDSLISENLVPPKKIGYLKKGMPVSYQVDTYNYNEWGLATGFITDISNEIYLENNEPVFKVRCAINEKYLILKNGYRGQLKKGLTTTTRFNVTKRTPAQLLFDKTDNWLNPNIINEDKN
ncbi:MAG: HlyD family efflux transporter periplasmic adaptor subunit [Prolixibacteraceae bacterium]|nr:HlyD family efflux transporter periplasmic adaptor subunit [Prolixibacteraceae bacterium]